MALRGLSPWPARRARGAEPCDWPDDGAACRTGLLGVAEALEFFEDTEIQKGGAVKVISAFAILVSHGSLLAIVSVQARCQASAGTLGWPSDVFA